MIKLALVCLLSVLALSACTFPFNQTHPNNPLCPYSVTPPTFVECVEYKEKEHDIRYRTFPYDLDRLLADYPEEHDYIASRRKFVVTRIGVGSRRIDAKRDPITQPVKNLSGLAMSGGGIRSASFQLGVLQALVKIRVGEQTLFDKLDYMSSVSGGSYTAGWVQSHLGPGKQVDERGWLVRTDKPESLLEDQDDFVQHLRAHAGFLREGGFWEGPRIIWSWLWRWPFSLAWDLGLHVTTVPPVGNAVHQVHPYRDRIAGTYLRGRAAAPLAPLDGEEDSYISPYIIINGNLVNSGRQPGLQSAPWRASYNFEFTRDFTGSDGLGYVETKGFGWPVHHLEYDGTVPTEIKVKVPNQVKIEYPVLQRAPARNLYVDEEQTAGKEQGVGDEERVIEIQDVVRVNEPQVIEMWDQEQEKRIKVQVTVRDPCETHPQVTAVHSNDQPRIDAVQFNVKVREIGPPCFRLADAMVVSSAAFDVKLQLLETLGNNEVGRLFIGKALGPANLNYVHQTWNFTQGSANVPKTIWDNFNMLTFKRLLWPNTQDPWIEIADGAVFDNLAAFALIRRGVHHVIVSDATYDPTWNYHYLKRLRKLVDGVERVRKKGEVVEIAAETKHEDSRKQLTWCDGNFPEDQEIIWYRKFWVKRPDGGYTVIHYLKPYAYNPTDLFSKNKALERGRHAGAPFLSNDPGDILRKREFPDYRRAKHLVADSPPDTTDDQILWRRWTTQVNDFAKSGQAHGFPQTTSWLQWYEVEEFEAYRRLGYLMGKAYLSGLKFNETELQPPPRCRPSLSQ